MLPAMVHHPDFLNEVVSRFGGQPPGRQGVTRHLAVCPGGGSAVGGDGDGREHSRFIAVMSPVARETRWARPAWPQEMGEGTKSYLG